MLLTITTKHITASDMGFLLRKNPKHMHTHSMSFGKAHVFYPVATNEECTVALLLDVDPIGLVRRKKGNESFALAQYVNDRPYVASSFMSVALNKFFRTIMAGQSKHRQELVDKDFPFEVTISVLPCKGGLLLLEKLFKPLGYEIFAKSHELDENFKEWGTSSYFTVTLKNICTLKDLLNHLYVLIPVLDNDKHYYIADDEIEKLLRFGDGWLEKHPEKEMITKRYLKFNNIAKEALLKLASDDESKNSSIIANEDDLPLEQEELLEAKLSLNEQRLKKVAKTLKSHNAKRIIDLGCGEGNLLKKLLEDNYFEFITGCDVAFQVLEKAKAKLEIDKMPSIQQKRIALIQTALTYRDKRLSGYDGAAIVEVIEHLDLPRLDALRQVVFQYARPKVVVMTTPNAEYNVLFDTLLAGKFRHRDHRFEWTRKKFEDWCNAIAKEFGYTVSFDSIGDEHPLYGAPTQMGVFVSND